MRWFTQRKALTISNNNNCEADFFKQPVTSVMRANVTTLMQDMRVEDALHYIRKHGASEKIIYFYVIDPYQRLVGVVPTRRLLMADPQDLIKNIMTTQVITIPHSATVIDAYKAFINHRFLALPVVDENKRLLGVVDITIVSDEAMDIAQRTQTDIIFESIGIRILQLQRAKSFNAAFLRLPWLTATLASGIICAFITGGYSNVLQKAIILSFFMTLILGLGESVSTQSMTIAIQFLRTSPPTIRWYLQNLKREFIAAGVLGCGSLLPIACVSLVWQGMSMAVLAIVLTVPLVICCGCFIGFSIPTLLHYVKLDPKVAAGPLSLAITDICTVLVYFSIAHKVIG